MSHTIVCFGIISALGCCILQAQTKFVGSEICGTCHGGNVVTAWTASGHAKAYRSLQMAGESEPRNMGDLSLWLITMGNGARYGLPLPAVKSKHCLPCHQTAFGIPAQALGPGFNRSEGVQCESCHGPGSGHVELEKLKQAKGNLTPEIVNRIIALATLEKIQINRGAEIEQLCRGCHNGTCGEFDFEKDWAKVKH